MNRAGSILLALIFWVSARAPGGTNGSLEGVVRDLRTGDPLSGVNVLLVGTQLGSVTDTSGHYQFLNIRAASYQVRFSLLGYQTRLFKNVIVNPDLRTRLNVDLEPADISLQEVVVVQEKPLIQRDVTGTTFLMSGEEIQALPVDAAPDVLRLKPGVTREGNVRGGRAGEVVYLVDGLPVQDVMAGGTIANLPLSTVFGTSIYTGGFEPEYGNALSGVLNIITKSGTNEHHALVKADKDNLFGGTQNSRSTTFEVSGTGPVLADRIFYVAAVNGFLTDTRWWQDFRYFVKSPVDVSLNGFGKVDFLFTPELRLGTQVLYDYRKWHDYEFNWRYDLNGLPAERQSSYRLAAVLSHTVSDRFYYTASVSRYSLASRIGGGSKDDIPVDNPYQYDFFLRYIVSGQRAWWSRTDQSRSVIRTDAVFSPAGQHLLKFGGELNLYTLNSDVVKYEPRKTYFGKPLVNEPQLNFSSQYRYFPRSGALYLHDKIDLPQDGILLNLGLRYDFLDPRAERPAIEAIPLADSAYRFAVQGYTRASVKQQLSPRLGAAMQLAENGYLFINLGWYFQYPLFDYLYAGLDRLTLARGLPALTGNPDLEPERTKSYEISIKYIFPHDIVGSITYFRKETKNLVDTKTFIPGDSKLAGSFGFAEYVNTPFADATGVELVVSRERGAWITGELSYTFMIAEGTSGSAEDGFYVAQYGLPPAARLFPLSWDQRHTVRAVTTLTAPGNLSLNMVAEWHSGRPYTRYPTSTGFEPVDGGLFRQNNDRMPGYVNIDLKAAAGFVIDWWVNARLTLYLDIRNLTDARNVVWMDSNGRIGGELADPSGYDTGRRTSTGVRIEF